MRRRVALAVAVMCWGASALPARAGDAPPTGCIDSSAEEARLAGTDGGAPAPPLGGLFFHRYFSLDVSTDGFTGKDLAISIEEICDIPPAYAKQAAQLAGADGVAVISSRTRVYAGKRQLTGAARRAQINGADTMKLTVRLAPRSHWRPGEDDPAPTFVTRRAQITD
jgi:hypothetical protein